MNLQLPLINHWFQMTKDGVKKEDYREITTYWIKRLMVSNLPGESLNKNKDFHKNMIFDIKVNGVSFEDAMRSYWATFKPFDSNIMTLGYPKSEDWTRKIKLEHKGIEVREGNPEWGAEEGRLYFVIKHGKIIENE